MSRYCPYCDAVMPKVKEDCPLCGEHVPFELQRNEAYRMQHHLSVAEYRSDLVKRGKSHTVVKVLCILPVFFGLIGLGQIYADRRDSKGWGMLVIGLVLFWSAAGLIGMNAGAGGLSSVILLVTSVVPALLYVSLFIASAMDAFRGSVGMPGSKF